MKVSTHAEYRSRKRIGTKDADASFELALKEGLRQKDLKGSFKKFVDKSAIIHRSSAIVFRGMIYWFNPATETLITVTPIGQKWHKYLK